ncbi:MAG: DUF1189 family protein [Blastochloris sp.]|nr:DUF1189 family protein [Blastochloris sp.]
MRYLNTLWLSFFSRPLYREVFSEWRGIGLLYLLLLALIQSVILSAKWDANIDLFARDVAPALIAQIPEITIKDGVAQTPESRAYEVIHPQTKERLALIDTRLDQVPGDLGEGAIFVGKTMASIPGWNGSPQILLYNKTLNFLIDSSALSSFTRFIASWGTLFTFPITCLFQLLALMIEVLIFSLFCYVSLRSAQSPRNMVSPCE